MTMVFQVRTQRCSPPESGDKVKFAAEKISGALMVTRIESVN